MSEHLFFTVTRYDIICTAVCNVPIESELITFYVEFPLTDSSIHTADWWCHVWTSLTNKAVSVVKSIVVKSMGLYSVTWDILKGQKPRRRCIWRYIINADSFRTEQFQDWWKVGVCLVLQGTFIQGFQMLFLLDYSYAVAFSAGKGGGLIRHCHISMYLLIWWFDHYVQELNRARKGGGGRWVPVPVWEQCEQFYMLLQDQLVTKPFHVPVPFSVNELLIREPHLS